MCERQREIAGVLLDDPAVADVVFFVGVDGINPSMNASRLTVALRPLGARDERAPAIARRLMQKALKLPGQRLHLQPVQDLTIEDRVTQSRYQLTVEAISDRELEGHIPGLVEELRARPELEHVTSDLQKPGRMVWLNINRDTAGRLGVSMSDIDDALYDALGQRLVSTIFTQTNQYKVVLEVAPRFRASPSSLENLYVRGAGGGPVPLTALAEIEERPAAMTVARQGQFPTAAISFNAAENSSLGAAVGVVQKSLSGLPETLRARFQGSAGAFMGSSANQLWLIVVAVVTMYIVLGVLYESYVHPLTILSTLPSAGVGALLAIIAGRMELGVVGIIGIILLIGIVKKNAIMMIDFALEAERREGLPPLEAIRKACLFRLRPILMTTMAALLSALPLMLGQGMGAELRRPLGVTMVGGLIFSQMLTLFTTPVIYLWFDRLSGAFRQNSAPDSTQNPAKRGLF
jgi:multidrug efflux pump